MAQTEEAAPAVILTPEAAEKARKFVEVAIGPIEEPVPPPSPADIPSQVEPVPDTGGESSL